MIVPKFIIFFKNYFERVTLTSGRTDERTSEWMGVKQPVLSLCRSRRFVALSFCRFVVTHKNKKAPDRSRALCTP